MGNPDPTPIQKRGVRKKLNPDETTITKTISLPENTWLKLDEIAGKLSDREHCSISAQEVIRRSLRYTMSSVISKLAEGTILLELNRCYAKFGLEIKAIPKHRA